MDVCLSKSFKQKSSALIIYLEFVCRQVSKSHIVYSDSKLTIFMFPGIKQMCLLKNTTQRFLCSLYLKQL